MKKSDRPRTVKEHLAGALSPEEFAILPRAFDIVGTIAIIDPPEELVGRDDAIAQAIMQTHKKVTTVVKKAHKHDGEFRTQALEHITGVETKETLVRESGVEILVDVEKVYFSMRLSTERLRIAKLVKPGENVLVMFSGAGPYVCVIGKHSHAHSIIGVEKNPVGHDYALINVKRNKLSNATVYNADCMDISFLKQDFDRIIMPLPASAIDFLPAALSVAKNGAIIHFYVFGKEDELSAIHDRLKEVAWESGWRLSIEGDVRAGHNAPFVYRWSIECLVNRE